MDRLTVRGLYVGLFTYSKFIKLKHKNETNERSREEKYNVHLMHSESLKWVFLVCTQRRLFYISFRENCYMQNSVFFQQKTYMVISVNIPLQKTITSLMFIWKVVSLTANLYEGCVLFYLFVVFLFIKFHKLRTDSYKN